MLLTKNSPVLVTGANGFVGTILVKQLLENVCKVRTLTRRKTEIGSDFALDLAAENCPRDVCENIDTIFHLAGKAHALAENSQDQQEYSKINTLGTLKLLEAAKLAGVRCFVYFSSVKATGDNALEIIDETNQLPADTPYGISKFTAEKLVLEGGYVPHPVVIRPCMIYGNSNKGNLPRMIKAIHRGFFPPMAETHHYRSMVHVNDVVQAAILVANKPAAAGQIYIVTDQQQYSTRQLYNEIRSALGKPVCRWSIPVFILSSLAKIGDVIGKLLGRRFIIDSDSLRKLTHSAQYSSAKISRELGFCPQYTIQKTLPDIIKFLNLS